MKTLKTIFLAICLSLVTAVTGYSQNHYQPTPENLEARRQLVNDRFGIFLHWGIYASYAQGEWYLQLGGLNKDEYAHAASAFYPAGYNAEEWVKAFKDAGAGYVTITSRHHDGFSMFDTKASDYNIVKATPWGKDVMRDLADACHKEGLSLQFYYSILDWIREDYPLGESGHNTGRKGDHPDYDHYLGFMKQQVKELMTQYAPVRALWFDGYWDHKRDSIPFNWKMPEFYEYIHSVDPACLIGNNHHIQPIEGEDFQMFERDLPGQNTAGYSEGQMVSDKLPLEMCQTMNHTWGYSVKDRDYKTAAQLIGTLAKAVSMNTNLLLNIGPRADGRLPEAALSLLKEIGQWMKVNGESIKGCGPGPIAEQDWGVSTAPLTGGKTFYIHVLQNPGAVLEIPVAKKTKVKSVTALYDGTALSVKKVGENLFITLPADLPAEDYVISVTMK